MLPLPDQTGTKRRVPIACGRCRKRKIRCSGESADGTIGCNACQQAGVRPAMCVFLRVKCETRELLPDHRLVCWPPHTPNPFIPSTLADNYHWACPEQFSTPSANQDPVTLTERPRLAAFRSGNSTNGGHWQWVGPSRDFYFPPSFSGNAPAPTTRYANNMAPFVEREPDRPPVGRVTETDHTMEQYVTRIP